MLAAVFANEGQLLLEEREVPALREPGDILVAVEACGICGTDLQILATPPGHPATPGTILGHELVGRVVEAGADVQGLAPGQRVIVDPDPKCGACQACRVGRPANCLNIRALGVFRDGALASHVIAPGAAAYPISDDVETSIAALAEPLACVVNATRRAAGRPGETAVIMGAGAIGCLFLALLRASGAAPIIVVEPNRQRAEVARAMGADEVVAPAELAALMQRWAPGGADIVVDAVGSLLGEAIEVAGMAGRIVLFGMNANANPAIRQVRITERSLTILGSYISNFTFPEAISLLEGGRLELEPMVSAVLPLAEVEEGFERLRSGEATKVVIEP